MSKTYVLDDKQRQLVEKKLENCSVLFKEVTL